MSWLEGPDFIESSERIAGSLISSFPISRVEALTIVIIEAMCNHNIIATKKKTREVLSDQFGIILTEADMKSVERMFDIIAGGRTRLNSLSTPWVAYLWKNAALSNELLEKVDIPDCSDVTGFYEIDPRVISLIKHAISAKSPIAIMIDDFLQHMSLGIIKRLLEEEGIYCLIGSEMNSDDAGVYAMQAIQAMHLGGIVLFPESNPVKMDWFINMAQIFGFRFGALRTTGSGEINLTEDEEVPSNNGDDVPAIEYVPIINLKPSHISGEKLRKRASEYFSDDPEFLRILISSKSNVATLCYSRALIREIVAKQDWEALSKLLGDAQKAEISEDTRKRRQVNSDQYDIRVINSDIPIDILDKMAEKAFRQHSPWKLMIQGPSGSSKSSYAYHVAEKLGVEIIVKRYHDLVSKWVGQSEEQIYQAFKEAEDKHALLLLDEVDGYISRKTDVYSGGDKAHNDITTSFMVNLEEYNGLVIATSNHIELTESALVRRFHKIVEFKFPTYDGMKLLIERYFPDVDFDKRELDRICSLGLIGPGDFVAVKELTEYMEPDDVTGDFILESLHSNAVARDISSRRSPVITGFRS
ncbi:MAG TPA: AAA family ATPase [Candidatus Ornithospirochaeta stercorigallinarum]|nr:AAA family ATPase [Candidatus Ornithospirochaeta stercorigallinarum]